MNKTKTEEYKIRQNRDESWKKWKLLGSLLDADKGAYIKYVGVGAEEFYKFFKKKFVAQERLTCSVFQGSTHSDIPISNH